MGEVIPFSLYRVTVGSFVYRNGCTLPMRVMEVYKGARKLQLQWDDEGENFYAVVNMTDVSLNRPNNQKVL